MGESNTFKMGPRIRLEAVDDRASLHVNYTAYELTFRELDMNGKPKDGVYPSAYRGTLASAAANSLSTSIEYEIYGPPDTDFDWHVTIKHTPKPCDNCGSPGVIIYEWVMMMK